MGKIDDLIARLGVGPARNERVRAMLAMRRATVDLPYMPDGTYLDAYPRSTAARFTATDVEHIPYSMKAKDAIGMFVPDRKLEDYFDQYDERRQGVLGTVVYPQGDRRIRRHEVMHAINEGAKRYLELPNPSPDHPRLPIGVQLTARLPHGLNRVFDEALATRAGGDRVIGVPWAAYANYYANEGDKSAARIADMIGRAQAIYNDPRTLRRAGELGAAATSPWWATELMQDDE